MSRTTLLARLVATTLLGSTAVACGYTEMHDAVLRPTSGPSSKVELYLGDQPPNRPFYEVALLQVMGYGSDAEIEDLSAALEARGRALGCDAVLRTRFDLGRTMAHGYGVCVKWAGVQAAPAAPVPPPSPAAPAPVSHPEPSPSGS